MKYLLLSFFLSSCSYIGLENSSSKLPEFDKQRDCSPYALGYVKGTSLNSMKSISEKKDTLAKDLMHKLTSNVQACYQEEIDKGNNNSYNLCLIVGYDKKGNQHFFNFSANKKEIEGMFGECLLKISKMKELNTKEFKNGTILQPFRLLRYR